MLLKCKNVTIDVRSGTAKSKHKNKMNLTDLRVDRLKWELCKLELSTTGTKNELQRRLREKLQLHGIDIESYELEEEEKREIQASVTPNGGYYFKSMDGIKILIC